jgi:adenylylsulfate reductase subunit A
MRIMIAEKAHISRSGCLAAGINAINAHIGRGHCPDDYVDYAEKDAAGIARGDLLASMAGRLNKTVRTLEKLGLVVHKDADGRYAERGWRNVRVNGENIKPLLAAAVQKRDQVRVLNRVNIVSILIDDGRAIGAVGFGTTEAVCYVLRAAAIICATGGAAGLYSPNSPGFAGHCMWYPPFNTGAGYAMGILAGAEMTTLEMRFVALRCKGSIAPTGTLAQGLGAAQINSRGENYENRYGTMTAQRVYGTLRENLEGRGPCRLHAGNLTRPQVEDIYRAYLNMAPAQTLKWLEEEQKDRGEREEGGERGGWQEGKGRDEGSCFLAAEIEGTEPYLVGGHAACGYWVDSRRATTVPGLFAAGDAAGGCPQKYASGAMAEAEIAAEAALEYALEHPLGRCRALSASGAAVAEARGFLLRREEKGKVPFEAGQLEEAMQQAMDRYAGGISAAYRFNEAQLAVAAERIGEITFLSGSLGARDMRGLLRIHELRERLVVCRSLIAHLGARRETRWPGFAEHTDYPGADEAWRLHVNSRLQDGRIRVMFRDLVGRREVYEHRA